MYIGVEELEIYYREEVQWIGSARCKAKDFVASGPLETNDRLECIRVPTIWRNVAGAREYLVEVGAELGKRMVWWHRPVMPILNMTDGDSVDCAPSFRRADEALSRWWAKGFRAAVEKTRQRLSGGGGKGKVGAGLVAKGHGRVPAWQERVI